MKSSLSILTLFFALAVASFAQGIQKGATVQVPPNSIWFQDDAKLSKWQQLKASGKPDAQAEYQQKELKKRNAFQFDKPLKGQDPQLQHSQTSGEGENGELWSHARYQMVLG